jgi:hypothetical protein
VIKSGTIIWLDCNFVTSCENFKLNGSPLHWKIKARKPYDVFFKILNNKNSHVFFIQCVFFNNIT